MSKIILRMNISNIKRISHGKWNKLIKIINGNREYKKPVKTKRYFKIVIWNKGNSNLTSDSDKFLAISTEILHQNGDLVILSEAEFNPSDEDHIKGEFPNYEIFFKLIPGAIKARILVLIKKDTINITRLTQIEQAETACMWFKIKTEDKNFTLAAWYRQWNHPAIVEHMYTDGINGEVERLESMKLQVKKAKNISSNIIITGDTNIDMLEEKRSNFSI